MLINLTEPERTRLVLQLEEYWEWLIEECARGAANSEVIATLTLLLKLDGVSDADIPTRVAQEIEADWRE